MQKVILIKIGKNEGITIGSENKSTWGSWSADITLVYILSCEIDCLLYNNLLMCALCLCIFLHTCYDL